MTQAFSKQVVFRSVLMVTGSTYVNYASGLLVSTLIARSLGPADYGRYSYLVWLCGVLIIFFTNGLTTSGIRFVSECLGRGDPGVAEDVHGWLQKGYYASLAIVTLAFCACVRWLEPAGWAGHLWVFAAIALISAVAKAHYLFRVSIAKGYGLFGMDAATTSMMSILGLLGTVALAVAGASLNAYVLLFAAVSLGHAIVAQVLSRRARIHPRHEAVDQVLARRIRQHLWWTIVLTMVGALTNKSLETFLLNKWAGPEAVGFFLIAAALTRGGIDLLCSGLNSVLMSAMSHAFGVGGIERVNRILIDALRYFVFLGLLLAGVGVLWANSVIAIMYGAKFSQAAFVLQMMVLVGGLTLVEGAFGAVLSTTDNQKARVAASVLYVVVTAVTAFSLVPVYGLMGAIWAHVLSRSIVTLAIAIGTTRMLRIRLPYAEIARLLGAAACGALAALPVLLVSSNLVAQFIAGIVYATAYAGSSVLLRAWHQRDLQLIGSVATRIPMLRAILQRLERWMRAPAADTPP
ncbi:lipopolysaccharide biosynthesis protein [Dokdonella soli]|uniref:Polysaccharide biosynthesis protein C-terminal domain-containing protein n=1 Tax=Dokdonella soli TaxID=529810 RepID=A0ABN1IJP1_9GAMM